MEEQSVVAMEEQTVVAMEEQTVVAMEEQSVVAMEEQTVVAMEEQTVVAMEEQSVAAMEEQSVASNDQNLEKNSTKQELIAPKEDVNDAKETKEISVSKTDEEDIIDKKAGDKKEDNIKSGDENKDTEIKDESEDNNKIGDAVDAKQIASNSQVDANPFSWGSSSADKKKGPVSVPTFIHDVEYVVSAKTKKLIILNQKHFASHLGLTERKGTERDEDAIMSTFKPLGWDIDVHNDLNLKQVRNVIMDIQTAEVDQFAALAIFILSHGEDNGTVFTYDGAYRIYNDVLSPLAANKCPALAGRPKMIFVQACQGRDVDSGTDVAYRRSGSVTSHDAISTVTYKIPNYADFLIYQASFCGHYSFRNSASGSWFIQSLCSKIHESRSDEALFDVLLEVSRGIAIEKESYAPNTPQLDMKKQVPLLYSTMLRKIYLKDRENQKDTNMDKQTVEAPTNADKPSVQASINGSVEKSGPSLDLKVNGTSSGAKNKNKNNRKESCVCM